MKKMLIIAILSIISLNLYSQDKEPVAWPFKYNTNANALEFNPNDFLQSRILFGFQWGVQIYYY